MNAAPPGSAAAARMFIALWPDDETRCALAACRDRFDWPPGARPVATGKLHLTLHFLGSLPSERAAALGEALQAVPTGRVELQLAQIDCWPGGLTVLTPNDAPAALCRLHAAIGRCLDALDLPIEARQFCPHVTLARRHRGCEPALLRLPICWQAEGFALVHSMPDGRYRVVRRYR